VLTNATGDQAAAAVAQQTVTVSAIAAAVLCNTPRGNFEVRIRRAVRQAVS
jgi:hypothetical protein